jgi:hypothetical protein
VRGREARRAGSAALGWSAVKPGLTGCARSGTPTMKIRNVKHKGLKRLIEKDDAAGLPAAVIDKVRKIVFFLQSMMKPTN